jgi:hypothetical protein
MAIKRVKHYVDDMFHYWKSLLESKLMQRLTITAHFSKQARLATMKYYYKIGMEILNLKGKPSTDALLQLVFIDIEKYIDSKF